MTPANTQAEPSPAPTREALEIARKHARGLFPMNLQLVSDIAHEIENYAAAHAAALAAENGRLREAAQRLYNAYSLYGSSGGPDGLAALVNMRKTLEGKSP